MKNTILNFEERTGIIDGKEYTVPDYFSKNTNVKSFFDNTPNKASMTKRILLQNNEKLERLQYEFYKNTDYWDIIQLINGIDPLVSLPLDDDFIREEQDSLQEKFFQYYYKELSKQEQEQIKEDFQEDLIEQQNKKRYITIINPDSIPRFLSMLKSAGFM